MPDTPNTSHLHGSLSLYLHKTMQRDVDTIPTVRRHCDHSDSTSSWAIEGIEWSGFNLYLMGSAAQVAAFGQALIDAAEFEG